MSDISKFNPGLVAFGKNLSKELNKLDNIIFELNRVVINAQNQWTVGEDVEQKMVFNVPRPENGSNPINVGHLFRLFGPDYQGFTPLIRDPVTGIISVNRLLVNRNLTFTMISGSSTLQEGYIYYLPTSDNNRPNVQAIFSSHRRNVTGEILLCRYRYDANDDIMYETVPNGTPPIEVMSPSLRLIANGDLTNWVATEDIIAAVRYTMVDAKVFVNGVECFSFKRTMDLIEIPQMRDFQPTGYNTYLVYLKKGDKLTTQGCYGTSEVRYFYDV